MRFGEEVAEQLAALLRPVRDLRLLGEVGDIVILAASGDDLLLRVTGLIEAGPGNGDLRA